MLSTVKRVMELLGDDPECTQRYRRVFDLSRRVRPGEYHVTTKCNIRCKGCWYFEYEFDRASKDVRNVEEWRAFAREQRDKQGVTAAMLIGGEPTLYPDRIKVWVETIPYVTVSTNGLHKLPMEGFEKVCVAISLFGGGELDDQLRAIRPSGSRFAGLFETSLSHYRGDPRAVFIYAISNESIRHLEETICRIGDNGNRVGLNYYSTNQGQDPLRKEESHRCLLDEALRVRSLYPEVLGCDEMFIETLITGRAPWGEEFGYDTCPSVSSDYSGNVARLRNGRPVLPGFNAYASDLRTVVKCCTSGHCDGCRDSQAVYSWLLVNFRHFLNSKADLLRWLHMAEAYWSGFIWSPYHPSNALVGHLGSPAPSQA